VVAIDVDENTAVAVDAPAEEVREHAVRYRERPEGTALGRREPRADKPIVETSITPQDFVMDPSCGPNLRDRHLEAKTAPECLDLIYILRDERQVPLAAGQFPSVAIRPTA